MDLNKAKDAAHALMQKHGLEGWKFEWSNKRVAAGTCHGYCKKITLSRIITAHADEIDVINVILHEIAHALAPPGSGHNWVWKQKLIEIGGDGERCYDDQSSLNRGRILSANWKGTCPNGHVLFKIRHKVKARTRQSCGQCRPGKFDERFIINWEKI